MTRILATFFYTGYFPFAPATFASLVFGTLLFFLPTPAPLVWVIITLAVAALGVVVSTRAETIYGHDGSPIVIDEILGMLITLFAAPKVWWVYLVGFFLFRVFDIVKPFPAGRSQSLPAGWGVMTDDAIAGLYSLAALQLLLAVTG